MDSALTVTVNGRARSFEGLSSPCPLSAVLEALGLRPDRVAVELNGEIAPRGSWSERTVSDADRLEVVHFVGGGRG
jgi:sulfur carrier protein